ncbi:L,D-transpeptidase catalytic domain [Pseudovibrio axinellae]|uniref:L,D-transpeptidase catalytic domain n=1 Tax=Pseudovibrio axinellae TaxID=989403 RepID=A0A161V4F0_9HYPH|nr:L,D-transpeptidase family protein [Pseudovibrio axinellae]KZL19627.1 L,D-transpeptidase catalytic domain [Pseudovibrio axinellae]SEQ34730.1 L,D-peptidoglycan transpeptidase YkuD, ErfK/YbiS/YcfS/YnhG family [Pseudovibrio axinellae]
MLPLAVPTPPAKLRKKTQKTLFVRHTGNDPHEGTLTLGAVTYACSLGRSGLTHTKQEGDGATPIGRFELLNVYYRADRGSCPVTYLPVSPLSPHDGWCDSQEETLYNRPVDLPFTPSHEKMWRDDRLYDIVVVLDYNMYPSIKGEGSAIFFHVAREGFLPTEGCVAVYPEVMHQILEEMAPGDVLETCPD